MSRRQTPHAARSDPRDAGLKTTMDMGDLSIGIPVEDVVANTLEVLIKSVEEHATW